MRQFLSDARFAVGALRRQAGVAAVVVATLALGIGANTALFSVADAVLLRPLPFQDPGRLVTIWETGRESPASPRPISWIGARKRRLSREWRASTRPGSH